MADDTGSNPSCILSRALNTLGCSYEMIKFRQDFFRHLNGLLAERAIIVGSKAEGITKFTESDIDCMYIPKRVQCVEDPADVGDSAGTVLMDTEHVKPGYTRLKLITPIEKVGEDMARYFCHWGDGLYLSSALLITGHRDFAAGGGRVGERAGPSIPGLSMLMFDSVTAFECKCKTLFANFIHRERQFDWPSKYLKEEVEDDFIYAMVVPVGYKTSSTEELEWRICFTLMEVSLVHTLNETQMKLYVLLKTITKEVINKIVPDTITSYFIKNLVFWMAEMTSPDMFKEHLLIDRLKDALSFLKECVEAVFLKNYVIPERNLFSGKLTDESAPQLSELLGQLIKEGDRMVERVPHIYDAVLQEKKDPRTALEWQQSSDSEEKYRLSYTLNVMRKALRKPECDAYVD